MTDTKIHDPDKLTEQRMIVLMAMNNPYQLKCYSYKNKPWKFVL